MPGAEEQVPEKPWRTVTIGHLLEDKNKKIEAFRLMNEYGILDMGGTENDNLIEVEGREYDSHTNHGTGAKNIDYIIHETKK